MHHARQNRIDFKATSRPLRSLRARHSYFSTVHDTYMSLQLPHFSRLTMNPIAVLVLREHSHPMPLTDTSVALSARSL